MHQGDCQSVPVPLGYNIEYPYYGSSARARFRCTTITDQPPVNSCPVVQCNDLHNLTTKPSSCSVKDVFNNSLSEYEGGVTCTMKGVVCQRWDSDYPHRPSFYRGRSDLGNRCQLESEHRPWCYTTDPEMRWDFCPVTDMDCGTPPIMLSPSTTIGVRTHTEWPYLGTQALAWYRCASFATAVPVSSCPVTRCDGDLTWSKANVSCSVNDCYDVTSQTYQGRVSCTNTGYTCQRWDSDTPHEHTTLSGRSDLQNWCQMSGESKPWCYTTIPSVRWEFCSVEQCPFDP
ncbi:plasminogen-like [Mizuhopecten yessoensis]|uniref:plasminogen-like n=1 Tax=Mizuhopecten yessoensis TaxID=6573 RepID=UPI000B45A7BB|nr:plasminogen-like [Mizuhopecten yessoensis]